MDTVFSHIIQKRFSQVNEDVATDALAFILQSSESARNGFIKMLRGVVDIPDLRFRTQQTEGSIRPDMWGLDGTNPRVFIENKFWAGLTDNQPVSYIWQLAEYTQPSALLFVVPAEREHALWRELLRRLTEAGITAPEQKSAAAISHYSGTDLGPVIALTNWTKILTALRNETVEDRWAHNDIQQLESLCDAADSQAFVPISSTMVTEQSTPAFILQLNTIVQAVADVGVTKGILNLEGTRPQSSWDRIGRYIRFEKGVGAWIGIRFDLWRQIGGSPLWLIFAPGEWSRGADVHTLLDPWSEKNNVLYTMKNNEAAVGLELLVGEEKDTVVKHILKSLEDIDDTLSFLMQENIDE